MKRLGWIWMAGMVLLLSCSSVDRLIATPTPTASPTPTFTDTPTPTATFTPTNTFTPTPAEAKLEVTVDDPVPCSVEKYQGKSYCVWAVQILFRESNGVGVEIQSVGLAISDTKGDLWFLDVDQDGQVDEWFDEEFRIEGSDESEYLRDFSTPIGGQPDFRNAIVVFRWKGEDDRGNRITGSLKFTLGE